MSRSPAELVRTMLRVQHDQLTGALGVRVDDVQTMIFFDGGQAVYATGGMVGDTLGRMLLAEGRLSEQQYAAALERMAQKARDDDTDRDMRLGEVLVLMGTLSVEQVREALARQVERKIERCLGWTTMVLSFNALAAMPARMGRFPCAVEPRVLSGARRHFDRARATQYLRTLQSFYLTLGEEPDVIADRFEANDGERDVIASVNGSRTTKDIIERNLRCERDPHAVLTALVLAAAVKATREPTAAARARSSRPVLRSRSSAPNIRAQSSHPRIVESEPPARISGVDFHVGTISSIPAPASDAHPQVKAKTDAKPPAPRKQLSRLQAEQAFQRGLRYLRAGRFARAAEVLADASRALPDALEYQVYARWASYRACDDPQLREQAHRELEPLAKLLAKQDRAHGLPPYVLGHLALAQGQDDKALKLFKMAVRRDAQNKDAAHQLRTLTARISKKA